MDRPPDPRGGVGVNTWRCTVPGCDGCGSGYPSARAARAAARRHEENCRAYHQHLRDVTAVTS